MFLPLLVQIAVTSITEFNHMFNPAYTKRYHAYPNFHYFPLTVLEDVKYRFLQLLSAFSC